MDGRPIFTSPTDMFSVTFDMVMKGGAVAAFPVLVYNVYALLLRPFLDTQRRRTALLFFGLLTLFYLAGTAFAYFVLLPTGLGFLLQFGTDIATPMIEITKYMELMLAMIFWLGIVFEIPVLMLMLAKLRLVSYRDFAKVCVYVPIAAVFFSMIITPTPDGVNMTLVAVPLILLYELGIFLAWLVRPKGIRDPSKPAL